MNYTEITMGAGSRAMHVFEIWEDGNEETSLETKDKKQQHAEQFRQLKI